MKNNSQNTESLSFIQEREVRSIGYLYEVFVVDTSDGYCYSCEIEDELAVTVYAYDIAFVTTKGSGEDTQLDMVTGKLLEWLTQEGYLFGMCRRHTHERLHDGIGNDRRTACATVVDQMILRESLFKECLNVLYVSLQKDKSAYGAFKGLPYSPLCFRVSISVTV